MIQNNSNYTNEQISKMKQEAINDAKNMYNKSTYKTYEKPKYANVNNNTNNNSFSFESILKNLNIDKDKALILILIYLLSKDKSNYKLILALLYLII